MEICRLCNISKSKQCITTLDDRTREFYQQIVESQKKFEAISFDPLITIVKSEAEEIIDEDYGEYEETYDDDDDEDYCEGDDGGMSVSAEIEN